MSEQTERGFESNVAEQRKKVALDLVGELQEMTKQRDELLAACDNLRDRVCKPCVDKITQCAGCQYEPQIRDAEAAIAKCR